MRFTTKTMSRTLIIPSKFKSEALYSEFDGSSRKVAYDTWEKEKIRFDWSP